MLEFFVEPPKRAKWIGLNAERTEQFEAVSLELAEDSSGDDGTSYLLMAVAAGAPPRTRSHGAGRHRRTLYSKSDDPTEPRNFAAWLSQRCQVPFADQTTADVKAKELEALKQKLANSGRLGRAVLGILERHVPSAGGVCSKPRP